MARPIELFRHKLGRKVACRLREVLQSLDVTAETSIEEKLRCALVRVAAVSMCCVRLARTLLSAVPTGVAHRRCVAFHANVVNALYHSSDPS